MDQTFLARLLDLSSPQFLLLFLLPLFFFIILKHISNQSSISKSLPPGPKPWPIIGNLLDMGSQPHISLANLAKIHGPLISLRLGTQILVVGSSSAAAAEILKTHDRFLSARYVPKMAPYGKDVLDKVAFIWSSECTERWKLLRFLCRTDLFSPKAIESYATLKQKKVMEMVEFLSSREGRVVNLEEVVYNNVFNAVSNLLFSRDFILWDHESEASGLKKLTRKMMYIATTPNIVEFYPIFAGLDPQGLKKKGYKCIKEMFAVWEIDIKKRRQGHVPDTTNSDFLDVFLANGFDDEQVNWIAMELLLASSDAIATTVEWAMSELLRHKEILMKLEDELKREIKGNIIDLAHISQLPYLNTCVKETLRLHPSIPLLIPHRALQTCEVMGYTIPKESKIIVNVWAIGRDPSVWEDPLSFKPDRFLDSDVDFKGNHYEFIPFGAGRRMCPALPLAAKYVPLILATLVYRFDWSLSNGQDLGNFDMKENYGVTLPRKQPLLLIPKTKP